MAMLSGIAKRLVDAGVLPATDASSLLDQASKDNKSFVQTAVGSGKVKGIHAALAASQEFGLPVIDLAAFNPEHMQPDLVKDGLIEKNHAIPLFKRGNKLYIGQSDPANLRAVDEFKFATGMTIDQVVVEEDKLLQAIDRLSSGSSMDMNDFADSDLDGEGGGGEEGGDPEDAPIVKFVNKMLLDAIKMGASDLHFEPYEKRYRVRFRIDGVLQEMSSPPVNMTSKISARLKVMCRMDISERRVPQDGRIKLKISQSKAIDFRVNTCPTLFGEKIVLRILDPSSAKLGIDALGYEAEQKERYLKALAQPQGMILVTGPTGSGKTVSLYTGLNILNTEDKNISTAEDPVEINLEGINQVNVNAKVGLDFSAALKSFLRQDPDIIMVGEIRDLDTANIAIKAAQTGHLVLSTLHTNSAPETLTRLANMGVPPFNIATSVSLIIAQRLARRLCSNCKRPAKIPKEVLIKEGFTDEILNGATLFEPVGCDACKGGGYKGRVGIYEVVRITESMARVIMEGGNSLEIADVARKEGFNDLRISGLMKVAQGVTSLEEANRVTTD